MCIRDRKTIDKDVAQTDNTFGFSTALEIATEAIDRLHSTAHSHHRILLVELMGHRAGWLTLGAGIAGGADIILLPEIPFTVESVAATINARRAKGSNFSVVAVAEGARDASDAAAVSAAQALVAVSYTHLDVYKRQMFAPVCPASPAMRESSTALSR